jgi:nucleotide-binding universal stress UspA family protein
MKAIKKILVVSRSTHHCQEAVETGISLARQYGASLLLLHVIHDPFSLDGWNLPIPNFRDELEKMKSNARKKLGQMVAAEKAVGLQIKEEVREGRPDEEILQTVLREKIDLLVMAAHPEGRLEHFLFGRTNDVILRKIPCAVLLVRQNEEATSAAKRAQDPYCSQMAGDLKEWLHCVRT